LQPTWREAQNPFRFTIGRPSELCAVVDGVLAASFSPVLRQNLIPTPNASHWSHITPVNMLYSNSQYENHSICKR
jgi:hypothetical protein